MTASFFNIERLIHSFKTAIACIIGIMLTRLISFPADQWIVVTIIVVMCAQIYVGTVVKNAYVRFLGTLVGCLFAMAAITFIGTSDITVAAVIGFSSFLFSFFAVGQDDFSQAGTLGAVTTAIIMISQDPTVTLAAERFLEISIGLLIATLVSQFILPIHARKHLKRAQANTMTQLKSYYENMIAKEQSKKGPIKHSALDEKIVQSLLKQRQLAKESTREPFGTYFRTSHFLKLLYCEKTLLRAIVFMHQAMIEIKKFEAGFLDDIAFSKFNDKVIAAFNTLAKSINSKKPLNESIEIPSLYSIKQVIHQNLVRLPREAMIYADGYLFAAETLNKSLDKLARLEKLAKLDEKLEEKMES